MWYIFLTAFGPSVLSQVLGVKNGAKAWGYLAPIIQDVRDGKPLPPLPVTPQSELEVSIAAPVFLWLLHQSLGVSRGDAVYAYLNPIVANVLAGTNPFPPAQMSQMGEQGA